jgi:hypothetical protein
VKTKQLVLAGLGSGQLLAYLFLLWLENLRDAIPLCQAAFFITFFLYLASLYLLNSLHPQSHKKMAGDQRKITCSDKKVVFTVIVIFALLFRIILWLSPPTLSDDIYRYLWEGRLVSMDINPFEYAPDAPQLEYLRDQEIFPQINHKNFVSIYPPLTQFIFSLSLQLHPSIKMMNLTFLIFDVLIMVVLILTLRSLKIDLTRIIIYAWNPLIIMEFAGSGHLDSVAIFFLMLSFYLFTKGKSVSSILSLALSFLGKLLALVFLPFILQKKKGLSTLLFVIVICVAYLPFLNAGTKLFQSLIIYSNEWVFNGSLYPLFIWILPSPAAARGMSAILLVLTTGVLFFWYRKRHLDEDKKSIYVIGFTVLGLLLLVTPVLHPWYVCWMVPFLVICPNRAWIFLTGSVFLSYWVLEGYVRSGVWEESVPVLMLEYIPFYALLLVDGIRSFLEVNQPLIRSNSKVF